MERANYNLNFDGKRESSQSVAYRTVCATPTVRGYGHFKLEGNTVEARAYGAKHSGVWVEHITHIYTSHTSFVPLSHCYT